MLNKEDIVNGMELFIKQKDEDKKDNEPPIGLYT
jgi:hypothetical protein